MNNAPQYVSGWLTEHRCVNCHVALCDQWRMYYDGRCPICGFKSPYAHTIAACDEIPYRLKRIAPRWKFWVSPERDYTPP